MKTSLEIAQEAELEPIEWIGERIGLEIEEIEPSPRFKATVPLASLIKANLGATSDDARTPRTRGAAARAASAAGNPTRG